ncbi:response regulator transcription factor [Nocardia transvalensis]|uniref:response regulator transcription factor n=1 Tax=Nocardia transvalensis TaxID=37333 RepID=UPI0018954FDE|nr:response regulator transcription factor [Nocardia transvalensis]MBF6327735.1 response regulator transcription factor [Nocardia transvalensis]
MIRVFLVDDHEVVRMGLRSLIDSEPDLETVGEAGSCAEALAVIPTRRPDVAVLDVRLPDGSGVELCRKLLDAVPDLHCLMLTSFIDNRSVLDAVLAGANGFMVKDIDGSDLLDTIRAVAQGRSQLDERAVEVLLEKLRADAGRGAGPLGELTDRERELLRLLGEGLTNREIAGRLFLSERTVKNYVSQLLAKLGLDRRTQAAVLAVELGLVSDHS